MPELYCKPAMEGPQILLEWDLPAAGTYTDVLLVRREKRFPETVTDGTHIVATTSGTKWADINNLESLKVYYYTLFTRVSGVAAYTTNSQSYTVALGTNYFKEWLYNHVAEDWRSLDRLVSIENGQIQYLKQSQSGSYGEYSHIGEDGTKPYYSLERYLRNLGIQLDRSYSLLKFQEKTLDVNNTPAAYLKSQAELVKAKINSSNNIAFQRHKVRSSAYNLAQKGTFNGVNRVISEHLEDIDFEIDEKFDNVVYFSDYDSGYLNLSEYQRHYGGKSGTEDCLMQLQEVGRIIGPDIFVVWCDHSDFENLEINPEIVFGRLSRELDDYIPASSTYVFNIDMKNAETTTAFETTMTNITDLSS